MKINKIYIGQTQPSEIRLGNKVVKEVRLGDVILYGSSDDEIQDNTIYWQGNRSIEIGKYNNTSSFDADDQMSTINGEDYFKYSPTQQFSISFYSFSNGSFSKILLNVDTSALTGMYAMFANCKNVTNIAFNIIDTSNCSEFGYMFGGCSKLANIDVSSFDTSKSIEFEGTFMDCSSLTQLDLSKWNVSKSDTFQNMFLNCSSLKTLNLSGWSFKSFVSVDGMFKNCSKLTTIIAKGCDSNTIAKIKSVAPQGCLVIQ